MTHQYIEINDTVYFGFVSNDTSGSGVDGTTPLYDVRLSGGTAGAAPIDSGTPTLLTNAAYGPGAYEVEIDATTGNGFAADNTYLVFVTVTADSETPGAMIGSFFTGPVTANTIEVLGTAQTAGDLAALIVTADTAIDTIKTETALIVADTAELQTDNTPGALSTINSVVDSILAMLDDTRGEPAQGAPPVNPDAMTKLDYIYKFLRNKKDQDGVLSQIYADDGSTVDHKATTSESGGTVTHEEWVTGA